MKYDYGHSIKSPIIIDADNGKDGVSKEYEELESRYGKQGQDWTLESRNLSAHHGKTIEIFSICSSEGNVDIFFDISRFYGKSKNTASNYFGDTDRDGEHVINRSVEIKHLLIVATLIIECLSKGILGSVVKQVDDFESHLNSALGIIAAAAGEALSANPSSPESILPISMTNREWVALISTAGTLATILKLDEFDPEVSVAINYVIAQT